MKKYFPALALLLFLTSEAFLRHTFLDSSIFPIAFFIFVCCAFYFVIYFKNESAGAEIWNSFFIPSKPIPGSVWIAIALILIGGLFRFWRLGSLFEGMAWDEAYKGLDAIAIREFGERPVYLNWNAGREALIAYLVAGSQHFFDYSIISVRAVLALAGTLTLAFCYLFFRKIFNQNVALLSTFLMAVSKWHIIHSRYGVRVALIVLFELSALYCVARAMNASKRNSLWLILAGAITGLGFYTYIAFRIFPLVLILLVLQKDVRAFLRNQWKGVLAGLIVFLVVLFPLARYFVENSSALTERISRTAVWSAVSTKDESPAHMVMRSTLGTLGLFTYQGDSIPGTT